MVWGWICLLICLAHKYPFLVFSQKPILPSHLSSGPSAGLLMGKQPSITVLPMVRCMQQMAGSHSVLQSHSGLCPSGMVLFQSHDRGHWKRMVDSAFCHLLLVRKRIWLLFLILSAKSTQHAFSMQQPSQETHPFILD